MYRTAGSRMREIPRATFERIASSGGGSVFFDVDLSGKSTIGIGGHAPVWFVPGSPDALKELLIFLKDEGVAWKVIGRGSNVLFPDGVYDKVFISLSHKAFNGLAAYGNEITIGAGRNVSSVIAETMKMGLSGLEGLIGIPATVGGALKMNASYVTSISEPLIKVLIMREDGTAEWVGKDEITFSYRKTDIPDGSIVIAASFRAVERSSSDIEERLREYMSEKARKQPIESKTLGCVFKNPGGASSLTSGQMIDMAGLKGLTFGGARISEKHANFIENAGHAKADDVRRLVDQVKKTVLEKYNVLLDPEIEILCSTD